MRAASPARSQRRGRQGQAAGALWRLAALVAVAASCEHARTLPVADSGPPDGASPADQRPTADKRLCTPGQPGSWAVAASGAGDVFSVSLAVTDDGTRIGLTGKMHGAARVSWRASMRQATPLGSCP